MLFLCFSQKKSMICSKCKNYQNFSKDCNSIAKIVTRQSKQAIREADGRKYEFLEVLIIELYRYSIKGTV
ncbi:hypothetical protein BCL69_104218 [Nitrosomonas communis]|uniref:Uncharacterized protein n=1 Tax=Nitrosomonas communis TaxID=44574 RepID=A0A5D3Y9W3_9PROT|nr:hypothetical protein BCL69_104218 [Nitrosomonas communis]